MVGKYYWLKLKENFFQSDVIEWLEEQKGGKEYVLLYIKLCLLSLKSDGRLARQVGTMVVPYTIENLARQTNTNAKIVSNAVRLYKQIGLADILKSGEIVLLEIRSMVGSESANPEAVKKRVQRQKHKNTFGDNMGTNCPLECPDNVPSDAPENKDNVPPKKGTNCPTEIRDKSIDNYDDDDDNTPISNLNSRKNANSKAIKTIANNSTTVVVDSKANSDVFDLYSNNICPITPILAEKVQSLIADYGEAAVKYGIEAAVEQGVRTYPYVLACAKNYLAESGREKRRRQKVNDVEGTIAEIIKELDEEGGDIWP